MTDTSKEAVENLITFHGLEDGLGDVADTLREFQSELDEVKAEIERLRGELQFYACDCGGECEWVNGICGDGARQVLKGSSQ